MYKDGDPIHFELFTGERTDTALLQFIREQMSVYKFSHDVARSNSKAQFDTKHGALSAGADLYSAMMFPEAAKTFCSSNPSCSSTTVAPPVNLELSGPSVMAVLPALSKSTVT